MKIKQIMSEEDVCKELGVTREQLDVFRQKRRLPFLAVDSVRRVYLKEDVLSWLLSKRLVLS